MAAAEMAPGHVRPGVALSVYRLHVRVHHACIDIDPPVIERHQLQQQQQRQITDTLSIRSARLCAERVSRYDVCQRPNMVAVHRHFIIISFAQ